MSIGVGTKEIERERERKIYLLLRLILVPFFGRGEWDRKAMEKGCAST